MGPYGSIKDQTGPYGTIKDHIGPYKTKQDHTGPYRNIQVHTVPYGTIWNHTEPYSAIKDHAGLYRTIQDHAGPYRTIVTTIVYLTSMLIRFIKPNKSDLYFFEKYRNNDIFFSANNSPSFLLCCQCLGPRGGDHLVKLVKNPCPKLWARTSPGYWRICWRIMTRLRDHLIKRGNQHKSGSTHW